MTLAAAPAVLELRGLAKRFGGVVATDDLSLHIGSGTLHALIGPNGAGKSTLIDQIAGVQRPDRGSVWLDGKDITRLAPHVRVAHGLARSYQVTNLFRRFGALDCVALAVQARSGSSLRFWRPVGRERPVFDEAERILRRVGLGGRLDVPAAALAHGEQRQLEVGLALATRPRVLLLDEPMAGMGSDESGRMVELIAGLKGSVTILLVEHDMDAVFRLADRISVLVSGRVIASDEPARVRDDAGVRAAYLGDEAAA